MILTGSKIIEKVNNGEIVIDPFNPSQINPNSYNFVLGNTLLVYEENVLDPKKDNKTKDVEIPSAGLVLSPDTLYLGHTLEVMGSEKYVPIIRGRSSTGRLGLFIHITADLIDIGSINQWTLMMHVVQPMRIYRGMVIGQVTFWKPYGDISLYNGKYKDSRGPVKSHSYKDFPKK